MNTQKKDIIVIGFALFSMFFGAGNLIFPPYLGLESGPQWFIGFLCYYLADLGLEVIVSIATPIIDIIYPPILVMVVMAFFPQTRITIIILRLAVAITFVITIASVLLNFS